MIYQTEFGGLEVREPSAERIDRLRESLPMGLMDVKPNPLNVKYGIVMQRGNEEAYAVKQPTIDLPKGLAEEELNLLDVLKCFAVCRYVRYGFSGALLPLSYIREKPTGHEVGIAYFGAPSRQGVETQGSAGDPCWDDRFGVGFTTMVATFMAAHDEAEQLVRRVRHPSLGLDYQPRLAIGTLKFGFAIHDGDVFMLNTDVTLCYRPFTVFRSCDIEWVYHLPSTSVAVLADR